MYFFLSFFIFSVIYNFASGFEHFLSSISGEVGRGNFSYYSMPYDGTVLVELSSVTGDCDLYVSQFTDKPTYEPESYCLQSSTCGLDSVIVPKMFNRPVWIGIFGHPSHDVSSYRIAFYRIADSRDIFNYDPQNKSLQTRMSEQLQESFSSNSSEEESYFWVIFRSLAVFFVECIL